MHLLYSSIIALALLIPSLAQSQFLELPYSWVYDDTDLPRIDITISPEDLDFILAPENESNSDEVPADMKYTSSEREVVEENIGFRLRGNTSRASEKKSFKISINEYVKGRNIDGFEKLNLNGEHNDPSMIRSKLCWDILNDLGVPSSRANHVLLYINDEFRGVYTNVEHIDEEYIEKRFDKKKGNLYKCLYPADLAYKGSDPNLYKEVFWGRRAYELKTNEDEDDYSGLANFISVLNNTSSTNFAEEIEKVFAVKEYLKALAVEALVGHWDNYSINQNNFYLYENPEDGKVYYIPYDFDNTLGIDFFNVDWAERDIYKYYDSKSNRPLAKKILANKKYRDQYTLIIDELLKNQLALTPLNARIDELKAKIQNAAELDTFRTLDYGFTISDFNKSFGSAIDYGHVSYSIKEYLVKRHQTATSQLDEIVILNTTIAPKNWIYSNTSNESLHISTNIDNGQKTVLVFSINGRLLLEKSFSAKNTIVNHQLAAGTYIVQLRDQKDFDMVKTQRILIRK